MTARAAATAGVLPQGRAIWLWPVAAAILAAWPVWRSLFPDVPDLGAGWLRLQLAAGLAAALLYVGWAAPRRRRQRALVFPFWAIALALGNMAVSQWRGDAASADLCALMIAWIASSAIFASLALIQIEDAGSAAGCAATGRGDLLPPIPQLPLALGIAMLVVTVLVTVKSWPVLIMGVISPGAVLAWAALSDTARSALSARRVHVSDAASLIGLARHRRWRLCSPAILLTDRPKLTSLYPAAGVKPGDLVALAAALTVDDDTDLGRAIQEFGVSHRIRLPALKLAHGAPAVRGRHATLQDGAEVELREAAALARDEFDLAAFEEAMALAQSAHRPVLAVIEISPQRRILGLIVFAIAPRAGAVQALQHLRAQGIGVALAAPPRDAQDEAALKPLHIASSPAGASESGDAVTVIRPDQVAGGHSSSPVVRFGTARPKSPGPKSPGPKSLGPNAPQSIAPLIVEREDARALADLARFAADFRARTLIVTLLANAPGWVLIAAAFGYVPASPLLVTGVALIGIAIAVVTPQVLRLSPALAKELDEE